MRELRLDDKHFSLALFSAMVLHALALAAWMHAPKSQVVDIPVRVLNLKLGDAEIVEDEPLSNSEPLEQALSKELVSTKLKSTSLTQLARQFVRERPKTQQAGSVFGSAQDTKAGAVEDYRQITSAHLRRYQFKPAVNMPARLVRGSVYVRMDRRGNVRYSHIEKSTQLTVLDSTMLEMVSRANPFPAAPAAYKPGVDILEFVFPIDFTK